jgi:hypothetical protein
MRKLTKQHKCAIITTMLAELQYYSTYCSHQPDITANLAKLNTFNLTNDVQQLHSSVVRQDTYAREKFIKTLRYIEANNLVSARCVVVRNI